MIIHSPETSSRRDGRPEVTIHPDIMSMGMEVLYHIFGHILLGYSLNFSPYIGSGNGIEVMAIY
jgi:hypothetical protein